MTIPKRVVIVDDTLRTTRGVIQDGKLMLYQDPQRRKVQQQISVPRVLADGHLEHALKRARRWIRNGSGRLPSGQMRIFLAAFYKADPTGFEAAVEEARALHERRPAAKGVTS